MNYREYAYYKGRIIVKAGKGYKIVKLTRNSGNRVYPSLTAATDAIDHDRRIHVMLP